MSETALATLEKTAEPPAFAGGAVDLGLAAAEPKKSMFAVVHDGSKFQIEGAFLSNTFDALLVWASERKASDVTIQTDEPVMAEIGAQIVPITPRPITAPEIDRIVTYVYGDHGPGMLTAGYDIDTAHEVTDSSGRRRVRRRYRINVTSGRVPGGSGAQITVRTLPSSPIPIEQLGIEPEIIANFRPKQGMVLVTGPTGSGKSTLLSSAVRNVLEREDANEKYIEYASPIEYVYDDILRPNSSVWQSEVGKHLRPHVSAEDAASARKNEESLFAYAIRNALRRKPTIIGVGEIRDRATMQAAIEAALTGHLLYSTTHVSNVPAALARLVQFFPHDQRAGVGADMMESLRMLVTQLLFPRAGGGRVAIREYLVFDEQTRVKFLKVSPDEWPSMARKLLNGGGGNGRSMAEASWEAFREGTITSDTYKKIVAAQRDQA